MTRHLTFVVVGVTLITVGVAMLLGCGSGCTWHVGGSGRTYVEDVELPHTATLKASSAQPLPRLVLDLDNAAVVVDGDAKVTGIEAEYVVRERTPGDVSIAVGAEGIDVRSASGSPLLVTSARIRVPPATPVRVTASTGSVRVFGIRGAAEVSATSDVGEVELASLADVATLVGRSSVGRVSLAGATGVKSISLESSTGEVSARDVAGARDVALRSDIGRVSAESVEAAETLRCESDTGEVDARDAKSRDCRLRSDIGAVRATRCSVGHLYAHTDLGVVELESCTYTTKDVGSDLGGVVERK